MNRLRSFLLLLTASIAALPAGLAAQGGAAPKEPDKEVADLLDRLGDVVTDRKFERDAEGLDIITALVQKWRTGLCEKDQKDVVKGLGYVFLKGKVRPHDRIQLYLGAAAALGETGEMGADPIEKAFDHSRFPDKPEWVPLREALLKAIGKTKSEDHVKFLVDIAQRHPEAQLQAAAGEALGNFDESEEDVRKEIVNKLLIRYGSMDSRARQIDPADIEAQNMRDRLAVISGKWNDTLRRMTRENFDTYPEWQEWYNKNKNKRWQ